MESQPKPLKVLLVITQGFWGGAQQYIRDLALNLPNSQVTIAVGEPNGPHDLQDSLHGQVRILPLTHLIRAIRPISDLQAVWEMRRLIKTETPDILHLNSSKAGIIGSLATLGLKTKPKTIYTAHGWVFLEPQPFIIRWLYKLLEKHTAKLKDKIIVLSAKEKRIACQLGIAESKLEIIPTGIHSPVFLSQNEARTKIKTLITNFPTPVYWIGTIANLFLTKGLDILIRAVPEILKTKPNAGFFIIGTGPEQAKLEKIITELNLTQSVHLLGSISNAATLLPAFDLFVLPSRKEGLPYTLLEAMAAGLPIVATAVGGVSALAENYPGLRLAEPNKVSELAHAIANPPTSTEPILLSLEIMLSETARVYQNLLESK